MRNRPVLPVIMRYCYHRGDGHVIFKHAVLCGHTSYPGYLSRTLSSFVGRMVLVRENSVVRKEGIVLFNDGRDTFTVIWLGHVVKDNSDSKRGNPLLSLHGLLIPIISQTR